MRPTLREVSLTNRGFRDDGTIDDLPWASVFDPAANARALSAIQAEGFRAASRIVDQFVRAVGSTTNGEATATPADSTSGNAAVNANGAVDGIQEIERLTRAWWAMVGQFLLRSMPPTSITGSESVSLDVNNPDAKRAVNLDAPVGGSANAEVWLHNRGPDDRGDVQLRCSDLLSHEGNVIGADVVRMDTAVVSMPARSSRGVAITVYIAPEVHPGVYRGTLLASGHPDLWLPVMLTVRLPST
ncbi:MAG TPA: hypothetical protein VE400_06080 [Mycobacterium sp.]|nr:hypothetical protein [Mycobacterium sp.]